MIKLAEISLKDRVLDKLADTVSFELPETLEKEEYNSICMAMNPNAKPDHDHNHAGHDHDDNLNFRCR